MYKRGKIWWINYTLPDGTHKYESSGTSNKQLAKKLQDKRRGEIAEGRLRLPRSNPPLLQPYSDGFLQTIRDPKTKARYLSSVRNLVAYFGSTKLSQITGEGIEGFKQARLEQDVTPATINRDLAVLRRMLKLATLQRLISYNPTDEVEFLEERKHRRQPHILTFEEQNRVVAVAPPHIRMLTVLITETGLRVGKEALPLKWEDIDFLNNQIRQLSEELQGSREGRSGLECAVSFHTKLVWIHPFNDGNGRTARLLLNAYLLSQGLPVIVINYADRERYLHCLEESNRGEISAMVELVLDCFEQQLSDLDVPLSPLTEPQIVPVPVPIQPAQERDPITTALADIGVGEDPLISVVKTKVVQQQKAIEAEYDAWKQSVLTIPAEFRAVIEEFNDNELCQRYGYHMRCTPFDLLTLEKYTDIACGRKVTRTWFVGLELVGPISREMFMWFFTGASWFLLKQGTNVSRVALAVSRFDGTRYVRLSSEPIALREVGYQQGNLLFLSSDRTVKEGNARLALKTFLADVIRSYL